MSKRTLVGVPGAERGVVRLFWLGEVVSIDALRVIMESSHLDPKHVDIIEPEDLGEGGLFNYMVEGLGIDPHYIDAHEINGLRGTVYFIRSAAFKGYPQNLQMMPPLRMIGEYQETRAKSGGFIGFGQGGEERGASRKPASKAKISGRIAMIALGVLLLLTSFMIWIAG